MQEEDLKTESNALSVRRRHTLVVRLGEKRVLDGLRRFVQEALDALVVDEEKDKGKGKAKDKDKAKEKTKTTSRAEKRKAGRGDDDGWDVDGGLEKEKGGRKRRK